MSRFFLCKIAPKTQVQETDVEWNGENDHEGSEFVAEDVAM